MTSDDADFDDLPACCAVDTDAISSLDDGLLGLVDAALDALPLDLFSAENGKLEDALLRLHGGGDDGRDVCYPGLLLPAGAAPDRDDDASLRGLLATEALDTFVCAHGDSPIDATSESAASRDVGGSNPIINITAVTTPASSSSSGASRSAKTDLGKDSNPTRRRVKQELDHLRERVSGLQATLHALQQSEPNSVTVAARKPSGAAWEGIAARQRDLRRKAETKNAKLRESLRAQLQLAKSLERLLHKRPSLWVYTGVLLRCKSNKWSALTASNFENRVLFAFQTNDAVSNSKRFCGTSGRVSGVIDDAGRDAAIFETLIAKTGQSYASYRETLTENGLLGASTGHRATSVKPTTCSGGESVCVELLDVKSMPFEASATCSAAWRCITSGYMQLEHEVYRGFEGASDILAIKYAVTMTRKRLSVDFTARAVMKKFVEQDRVVFVWESISDTDGVHCGTPSGRNPGIQVQEQGWTVFSSQERRGDRDTGDDDCQKASEPSTRIRTCMRMTPLVSPPSSSESVDFEDEGRQVGLLTNLSLDYFGEQLDHAHAAIESLLLDERSG